MAVRIRNLDVTGPVLVPLATGAALRLSPGEVSSDLTDVEVANNAKVDKLLEEGRTTIGQAQRKQIYDQAAKLIVDQASYVYLYNPNVVQGWSRDLKGYPVRADRATRFRDATLGE